MKRIKMILTLLLLVSMSFGAVSCKDTGSDILTDTVFTGQTETETSPRTDTSRPDDDITTGGFLTEGTDTRADCSDTAFTSVETMTEETTAAPITTSPTTTSPTTTSAVTSSATTTAKTTEADTDAPIEDIDVISRDLIAITDQKNQRISVYDLSYSDLNVKDALVWSWSPLDNKAVFTTASNYIGVTDARIRVYNGGYVVITCSAYTAYMISFPSGAKLWEKSLTSGSNPHAIELIPNGVIAIAASTAGTVTLYSTKTGKTASASLEDAHSVVWDETRQVLWAAGTTVLTAYKVGGTPEAPTLTEQTDLHMTLPEKTAHDLYPDYGSDGILWLTNSKGIFKIDVVNKTYTSAYDGADVISIKKAKSCGTAPNSGKVVISYPNGTDPERNWNTDTVTVFTPDGSGLYTKSELKIDNAYFYKVRVFCPDYFK